MFTGLIKEVGKVKEIRRKSNLWKIGVSSKEVYSDAKSGDSVSVNGVCLTVVDKKGNILFFEAVKSTLDNTNLKRLKIGFFINLEPSLEMGQKLGGHFVLGHVDCESKIKSIRKQKDNYIIEVDYPYKFKKYIVDKGSVAIEGISLTIQKVNSASFSVNIIPYSLSHTNLKNKRTGDWVNLEFDCLLKRK